MIKNHHLLKSLQHRNQGATESLKNYTIAKDDPAKAELILILRKWLDE
jgi:hypothetical protein